MKRQLDVGATLREAVQLYGDQAGVLIPVAFWLFLVVAIVNGLTEGDFSLFWIGELLSLVAGSLYTGIVVSLVRDLREGRRDQTVGELVGKVTPVLGPLVGASVVYGLGVFFGSLLLLAPGLYLATVWTAATPVIVVERRGVFDALGRSRHLVRGNGWRVFGLLIVVGVVALVPALLLANLVGGAILYTVLTALLAALVGPFAGLVVATLYFELVAIYEERQSQPPEPVAP
jgi:hypothetical protein